MKKRKVKENPLMNNKVNVKKISGNISSEEENEVKTFVIIIIIIALIAGVIYFITEKINGDSSIDAKGVTAGAINYDKISVGTLLNRPYENYYVVVYDAESKDAVKYSTMMTLYKQKTEDVKKIYYCDLGNKLNSPYYNVNEDNKSNPAAKDIKDLDFGDLTLLEIKNGKIVDYIEDYTTIHEKLK